MVKACRSGQDLDKVISKIRSLKEQSGAHSPSIATILREIPEISIRIDACFLSNPYATKLFMDYLEKDVISQGKLRSILEFYPPQNSDIRKHLSPVLHVPEEYIFVTNGAVEAIQAVLHNFVLEKLCVILPTFSSYYEFLPAHTKSAFFKLNKENNFVLDTIELQRFLHSSKADSLVIINPNNPDGGYVSQSQIVRLIDELKHLNLVIIDESFVHFAYEDEELTRITLEHLVIEYPNLVIIKSMSKDFGIAGLRAGYALMNPCRVNSLLKTGYLWNVSGLTDYFFKLYTQDVFQTEYDKVRKEYIQHTRKFHTSLSSIDGLRVYPTKANFALVELLENRKSLDFCLELLTQHGIYIRDCSDKIGLEGEFIRIASRTKEENEEIARALRSTVTAM